ncbi:hypothetical protein Pelo_19319 [Pelomyxa schiedti]|nr:hypothetical protein Pelo_19319 [Pelomyxa schiedti]
MFVCTGNLESVQRQTQQYAEHLQRARIVGFGSHLGYQLSKYVEVTLAGGQVYGSMSVEEIVWTINWWLEHDDEKDSESSLVQDTPGNGRPHTGQHNMYRDGARGLYCPYQFVNRL